MHRLIIRGYVVEVKGDSVVLTKGTNSFEFEKYLEFVDTENLEVIEEFRRAQVEERRTNRKGGKHLPAQSQRNFTENILESIRKNGLAKKAVTISLLLALSIPMTSFCSREAVLDETTLDEGDVNTPKSEYEQIIERPELPIEVLQGLPEGDLERAHIYRDLILSDGRINRLITMESLPDIVMPQEPEEPVISYEEKSHEVRERETLTKAMLSNLLTSMCIENPFGIIFEDEDSALDYLYENVERTPEEKMLIVMAREGKTYKELDTVLAGCVAEGGNYFEETYRVASTIENRCRYIPYINENGEDYYAQFTARNQFFVYANGMYKDYLGRLDLEGYQGALEMFYTGVSAHNYLEFRGSWVQMNCQYEQFQSNGNKYCVQKKANDFVERSYVEEIARELEEDLNPVQGMILAKGYDENSTFTTN